MYTSTESIMTENENKKSVVDANVKHTISEIPSLYCRAKKNLLNSFISLDKGLSGCSFVGEHWLRFRKFEKMHMLFNSDKAKYEFVFLQESARKILVDKVCRWL